MLKASDLNALYYEEKNTGICYTTTPGGIPSVLRIAQGQSDYWQQLSTSSERKQKALILADYWACCWNDFMLNQAIRVLDALMKQGFKIYIWQNVKLVLLESAYCLHDEALRNNISPEFKSDLLSIAYTQYQLSNDQVYIIHRAQLMMLSGYPERARQTIDKQDLIKISGLHNIHKIKKVDEKEYDLSLKWVTMRKNDPGRMDFDKNLHHIWPTLSIQYDHVGSVKIDHVDTIQDIHLFEKNPPSSLFLNLTPNNIADIASAAKCLHTPALKELELTINDESDFESNQSAYFEQLRDSVDHSIKLEQLSLTIHHYNGQGKDYINALFSFGSHIKTLSIIDNDSEESCDQFVNHIELNHPLTELEYLYLSDSYGQSLNHLLNNATAIKSLKLVRSDITEPLDIKTINPLDYLSLDDLSISAENFIILSKKCKKLRLNDVIIKGDLTDSMNLKSVHSIDCYRILSISQGKRRIIPMTATQ